MPKTVLGKMEYEWEGRSPAPPPLSREEPELEPHQGQRARLDPLEAAVVSVAFGARRVLPDAGPGKAQELADKLAEAVRRRFLRAWREAGEGR